MITGKVKRPTYESGDGDLILTATLRCGSETKVIKYNASVKAKGLTDTQRVALDIKDYVLPFDNTNIIGNVTLDSLAPNGSKITWASNKENVLSSTGIVNRPGNGEENETVTLTATFTYGEQSDTKEFQCTIKAWNDKDECDSDTYSITWDSIKGNNSDKLNVLYDLSLPKTGEKGSTITWTSNNANIISNDGHVTRPTYTQGDVVVTMTAVITKGSSSNTVDIKGIKVTKSAMTNKECVDRAANQITEDLIKGNNRSLYELTESMTLPKTLEDKAYSTVSLKWSLVKNADTGELDTTNASISVKEQDENYLCSIVRPDSNSENGKGILRVTLESTLLSGSSATSYKTFNLVVLKQEREQEIAQ